MLVVQIMVVLVDHDPFDDYVTFGSYAQVNSSLWESQLKADDDFDNEFLNIRTLNGESNSIDMMSYQKYSRFTGVWYDYDDCVRTNGKTRSKLAPIGQQLFGHCATYRDFMRQGDGLNKYASRVHRILKNEKLMDAIRKTSNLGFTDGRRNVSHNEPAGSHQPRRDSDDLTEEEALALAMREHDEREGQGLSKTAARSRRRRYEDDEDEMKDDEDDEDDSNNRRRGEPRRRTEKADSKYDEVFRRYLAQQPNHKGFNSKFDAIKSSVVQSADASSVAWKAMADELLGHSLLKAAKVVQDRRSHTKFPLTALEEKALHKSRWFTEESQRAMEELHAADSESLGWDTGDMSMEVYLDPTLQITAEVHQSSGALTLTSAYGVLFKIDPDAVHDAINSKDVDVKLRRPNANDLVYTKGKSRLALLQHSVNMSYVFQVLLEAAGKSKGNLKSLLSTKEPLSVTTTALVAKLKDVVSRKYTQLAISLTSELEASPMQLALSYLVRKLNALVRYLYHGEGVDNVKVIKMYGEILRSLENGYGHLPDSLRADSEDRQAETSGQAARYAEEHAAMSRPDSQLHKAASEAMALVDKVLSRVENEMMKRHAAQTLDLIGFDSQRMDIGIEDLVRLYEHYRRWCGVSPDVAVKGVKQVATVLQLVWSRKSDVFGGVDASLVADVLLAMQFDTVRTKADFDIDMKALASDEALLAAHGTNTLLTFNNDTSVVDAAAKKVREDLQRKASVIEEVNARFQLPATDPKRKAYERKPFKGHISELKLQGTALQYVQDKLSHFRLSGSEDKKRMLQEEIEELVRLGSANAGLQEMCIVAMQMHRDLVGSSLRDNDIHMSRLNADVKKKIREESDLEHDAKKFFPTSREAQDLRDVVHSGDADFQAVDALLGAVSLEDCRLNELFVQYGCEPIIGLIYGWPWILAVGSHCCAVKDGEVGNVMYIEPDCLLSENGQQKLVFFHMSMYFKAMVLNHRALARAFFVYCKKIEGGLNHNALDPLNETDCATVEEFGQYGYYHNNKSMLVIPTHIDYRRENDHMPITGKYLDAAELTEQDNKAAQYAVCQAIMDVWHIKTHVSESYLDCWDRSKKNRDESAKQHFNNVLMSQCHQENYNRNHRAHDKLIRNKGVMGPDISDGVMDVWNGKSLIIKGKIGSTEFQTITGTRTAIPT